MSNITVIVFSYNNETIINDCLQSSKLLTDKIILADMESNDNTVTIAKNVAVKVFIFSHAPYIEPARKFAIDQAETDWVFILDADERITPELAKEVKFAIKNYQFSHYKIPRKNIFGNPPTGGWLKHGGWWPDYQIRLINKKFFKDWSKEIHSTPIIKGPVAYLKHPFLHFFHGDLTSMVSKTLVFEDIESELLLKANRQVNTGIFFRKFLGELYRRLIKNVGFMDKSIGIIESIYQAFSKTITYLFLYEKKKSSSIRSLS